MSDKWITKHKTTKLDKLDPKIIEYLGTLPPNLQQKFLITATSDGSHSKKSLHYSNKAVDMRYDDELWNYISKDPKRHEYGLTLINPDHGTAKHIHLSNAKGTKNEWWGEVDTEGRKKVYETKGWDLKELEKSVQTIPTQTTPLIDNRSLPVVGNIDSSRYELSPVTPTTMGMDNWNPYGWLDGQVLLQPLDGGETKKRKPRVTKSQIEPLLEQVNPILRGAIEQVVDDFSFDDESPPRRKRDSVQPQRWLPTTSGKQGQYNAGNLRNSDGSFQSFSTPEEGRNALVNQLIRYQTGNTKTKARPDMNLYEAMSVYAPASDNNNPKRYAEFIANKLNISPDTPIKNINAENWADAISIMEGNKSYLGSKKENGGWLNNI